MDGDGGNGEMKMMEATAMMEIKDEVEGVPNIS